MLKKIIYLIFNLLAIGFYFILNKHISFTLDSNDIILSKNGENWFCQNEKINNLDKEICTYKRFDKFLILYYDSMPLNLFKPLLIKYGNRFEYHKLIQKGMEDSGPFMNSIFTGVLANKYEGKVTKLDNIFTQFWNSGYKINGIGSNFPFEELIGTSYFKNYEREKGSIICENMVNFDKYEKILYPNIINSLIKNEEEKISLLEKYYLKFKEINQKNKSSIDLCLRNKFIINKENNFNYKVKLDVDGHKYSGQSGIFIAHSAAILANLDYLINFLENENSDLLLGIISDHGVNEKIWMMEFFNHGIHKNGNEGFLALYSNKFNYKNNFKSDKMFSDTYKLDFDDKNNSYNSKSNTNFIILSTQFSNYFLSLIKNTNLLINNINSNPYRQDINKKLSILIALRNKENQLNNLMKINNNELSPFFELVKLNLKLEDLKLKDDFWEKYFKYVNNLYLESEKFIINLSKNDRIKSIFLMWFGIMIFILRFYYYLYDKNEWNTNNKKLIFMMLNIILYYFLYKNKIITEYFIYYFAIFSIILLFFNLNYFNFYLTNLGLILILLIYEFSIRNKFDYYFIFYNLPIFNLISLIILIFYIKKYFKFIFKLEQNDFYFFNFKNNKFILKFVEFFMFILIIFYEIVLMFHYNIKQNLLMIYICRLFIIFVVIRLIFSFNWKLEASKERLFLFMKINFWLCINYHRYAYFLLIFPIYFFFEQNKKVIKDWNNLSNFGIIFFNFLALFIFFILRGGFDCEISTRAAFRNWNYSLEENLTLTGIIFFIHKYLIFFIIPFIYCSLTFKNVYDNFLIKLKKKNLLNRIFYYFNNKYFLIINCWFGFISSIYLLSFENAINQRASYMFYMSAFLTNLIYYIEFFSLIICLEFKINKITKIN